MKRKILAFTLLLAVFASAPVVMAQTADNGPVCNKTCVQKPCDKQKCNKQECCKLKCNKQECCKQKCNKEKCDIFEGLNLTEQQKAKLADIRKDCKLNKDKKAGDRSQCKREFLAKVKEILTAEQYSQFLENSFVNAGGNGRHGHKAFGKHNGKCPKGAAPQNCPRNGSAQCPATAK